MNDTTRNFVFLPAAALVAIGGAALFLVSPNAPPVSGTLEGPPVAVGAGSAWTYIETGDGGEPRSLGIALSEEALTGLATRMNNTSRCWDKDGDGSMSHGECLGDDQATLALPEGAEALGLPVRWATVNWNAEGHIPPAPSVWSAPHFDFHFFIEDREVIEGIRPGPCGEFIDCDDFERAVRPLAEGHTPASYIDVGAAVPGMGNHLIDSQDPELSDASLGFSGTFIYGAYDGKLIFLEPMISHAFLSTRPDRCRALRTPDAYGVAGYYPTEYCVRWDEETSTYRISLEGLVHRTAA